MSLFFVFPSAVLRGGESTAIKPGDKVGIQFTCRYPNGEIAASTSTAVAKDSSLSKSPVYLPRTRDDPLEVTAGGSAGVKNFPVPFLDEIVNRIGASVVGMKPGELRSIEIRSQRPLNVPEKEQFLQLSRVRHRPKELRMTVDEYKSRTGKNPETGDEWLLDLSIPCKVVSVSENVVVVRSSVKPGTQVETSFGKGTVRENGDQYEIAIDAARGTPVRMGAIVGRISDVQDKMFTIDFGDPFGGEPLTCEVKAELISGETLSKKAE